MDKIAKLYYGHCPYTVVIIIFFPSLFDRGKFGQVFRLTHKENGRICAGKFYRAFGSKEKDAARKEIELMKELHHPKLVRCLGAFDSRSEIALIME